MGITEKENYIVQVIADIYKNRHLNKTEIHAL